MTKVKDSAMHFLSANSFCQFIKDNASATSALSVDDDELVALREVISAHRSSRKRSAEDALDEKPKASIGDHTEEDGQAKDNSPFSPKRACASAAEQEE
ncbi:MAG: hypothetical protein M1840_006108 [Geoglossum simile]|nr:MAG: hypothetical protein M1840_006108 [Geoglossum simile]